MSEVAYKPGVAARLAASSILGRVLRAGAWSNVLLADIDLPASADRALVRFLVYETIRKLELVDAAIGASTDRPIASVDPAALDILRIATTEIMFTRSPDHAAVDTAVETARAAGLQRATGFVNGVLRSVIRSGPPITAGGLTSAFGMPDWLVEELVAAWGEGETIEFLSASAQPAPLAVRPRPGAAIPPEASPGPVSGSWVLAPGARVRGDWAVQDPASVAVVAALDVEAGQRVLDLAAAPGGKTLQIADAAPAMVVASDLHGRRLRSSIRRVTESAPGVHWVQADATAPPFRFGSFDRILLDAPCSGLGTLRRRPEIRLKVSEGEVTRLAAQQRMMLEAAIPLLAPGGRLIYSVCTVMPAETVGVVEGLGAVAPSGIPGRRLDGGVLMGPHLSDTDGMFIAMIER